MSSMYDLNPPMITHQIPRCPLSVTDIERLAKAGVQIKFEDIATQVQPDSASTPPPELLDSYPIGDRSLTDSFWQRWQRANPSRYGYGEVAPWIVFASEHGDKVYLYVAPTDGPPFVLEDDKHLYPSDALMAKLHLRERSK